MTVTRNLAAALVALVFTMLMATVPSSAQEQSPDIDVSRIVSEFISDNARASFVIKGARTIGQVDTVSVVVQPSAIRTKNGIVRYKAVFDSLRRNGPSVDVYMHLTGKGLPLPPDSVRGTVRFEFKGIGKMAGSTTKFISPAEVRVANVTLPKPSVAVGDAVVQPIVARYKGAFAITDVMLRKPPLVDVEQMRDIRPFERDTLIATLVKSAVVDTKTQKEYSVDVQYVSRAEDGDYIIGCQVDLGKTPITKLSLEGTITLQFEARFWSRGTLTRRFQKEVFDVKSGE